MRSFEVDRGVLEAAEDVKINVVVQDYLRTRLALTILGEMFKFRVGFDR